MTATRGVLLVDGARYESAFTWLYEHYAKHSILPLLSGTDYEPIAEAGPILIDAPLGSPARNAWQNGVDMQSAIWLESDASDTDLWAILQRRLRILAPDGREYWLRIADTQPLFRAWSNGAQWPDGFWYRIERVWLQHKGQTFCAWHNQNPHHDAAPLNTGIDAQLTLDWPLLEALTRSAETTQDV